MYPDIVEVGPGGVVSFLFEAMGKGKKGFISIKNGWNWALALMPFGMQFLKNTGTPLTNALIQKAIAKETRVSAFLCWQPVKAWMHKEQLRKTAAHFRSTPNKSTWSLRQ